MAMPMLVVGGFVVVAFSALPALLRGIPSVLRRSLLDIEMFQDDLMRREIALCT